MLILERRLNEKIVLDDHITVMIVDIQPGYDGGEPRVRLGVTAPLDVPVYRQEVHDRIHSDERLRKAQETKGSAE